MEDAYFVEQKNGDSTTFAFTNLGAEAAEEGFDVFPGNVRAGRVSEHCFQCSLMGAFHAGIVPERGTERNRVGFLMPNVRAEAGPAAKRQARAVENAPARRAGLVF